jgi:hypothetical protein
VASITAIDSPIDRVGITYLFVLHTHVFGVCKLLKRMVFSYTYRG